MKSCHLPFDSLILLGGGSTAGNISQWTIDEFIGLNEFSQHYDYMEGSSRVCSYLLKYSLLGKYPLIIGFVEFLSFNALFF